MKTTFLLALFVLLSLSLLSQDYQTRLPMPSVQPNLNAIAHCTADNSIILETQHAYDSARVYRIDTKGQAVQLRRVEPTNAQFPHDYSSDGEWSIEYGRQLSDNHLSGLEIFNLRSGTHNHVAFDDPDVKCWFDYAAPGAPFRFTSDNRCALVRIYKDVKGQWSRMIALVHLEQAKVLEFIVDTSFAYRTDVSLLDASVDVDRGTAVFIYRMDVNNRSSFFIRVQNIENGNTREVDLSDLEAGSHAISQYSAKGDSIVTLVYGTESARRIVFDAHSLEPIGSNMMKYSEYCTSIQGIVVQPSASLNRLCLLEKLTASSTKKSALHVIDCDSGHEIVSGPVSIAPTCVAMSTDEKTVFLADTNQVMAYDLAASERVWAAVPGWDLESTSANAIRLQEMHQQGSVAFSAVNSYMKLRKWTLDANGLQCDSITQPSNIYYSNVLPEVSTDGTWLFAVGNTFHNGIQSKLFLQINQVHFYRQSARCISINTSDELSLYDSPSFGVLEGATIYNVHTAEIDPTDKIVAVLSRTGTLQLHDADNLSQLTAIAGITQPIVSMRFSPNGNLLCLHCSNDSIFIINVATSSIVCRALIPGIEHFCFSSDSRRLFCGMYGPSVKCFSLPDFHYQGKLDYKASDISDMMCLSDGSAIVIASSSNDIMVWKLASMLLDAPSVDNTQYASTIRIDNQPITSQSAHVVFEAQSSSTELLIYNEAGSVVLQTRAEAGSTVQNVELGSLANGVYVCELRANNGALSTPFVIAR